MANEDDIRDVMRSERQRGRAQRIDFEEVQRKRERDQLLLQAIEQGNIDRVLQVLRLLGYGPDSEEYRRAISLLRPAK